MENYIVINGKKIELTKEQLEKLGFKTKEDPFERIAGRPYYSISETGVLYVAEEDIGDAYANKLYNIANYCHDIDMLRQRALHEILNRLLWRFSMQNGSDDMDWTNLLQSKWVISFDYKDDCFCVHDMPGIKNFNPSFKSREDAQRAIKEIIKPFMEEHPDFIW